MTTPRKIFAAAVIAVAALFLSVGVAVAAPDAERVDNDEADGTHSFDNYELGDDNGCNFKYKKDGSVRKHKDVDEDDCPVQYPVTNPPNVPGYSGGQTSLPLPAPLFPALPPLAPVLTATPGTP
jgi:hypothetical protein